MEIVISLAKRHPPSLKLRWIVLRSLGEGGHNLLVRTYTGEYAKIIKENFGIAYEPV